jgi:hypothetical protein
MACAKASASRISPDLSGAGHAVLLYQTDDTLVATTTSKPVPDTNNREFLTASPVVAIRAD